MEQALTTDAKRTRLLKFFADVLDEKIEALYVVFEDQIADYESQISEEEWQAMEADYQAYLRGDIEGVTWEELRARITGKRMAA